MTTPAHVVLSLALLGPRAFPGSWNAITLGAVLPDFPVVFFYAWERLRGAPEQVIWSDHYYAAGWQGFFDLPNSIPLIVAGLLGAVWLGRRVAGACFASMLLHSLTDLPLHNDDGHRHFWPFSDFRFASPVSYWDPAHYGTWATAAEALLVVAVPASFFLWQRESGLRWASAFAALAWLLGFLYARWVWA